MPLTAKYFEGLLKKDAEWWKTFALLRRYPGGFSFDPKRHFCPTEGHDDPEPLEEDEIREWYPKDFDVLAAHKEYAKRFDDYLALGESFHDAVIDPANFPKESLELMLVSERSGHVLHNAAVLWLESGKPSIADMVHVTFSPGDSGRAVDILVHHMRGRMPCTFVEVTPKDGQMTKVVLNGGKASVPIADKPLQLDFPEVLCKGKARIVLDPGFKICATAFVPEKVCAVSAEPFTPSSEDAPNKIQQIVRFDYLECLQALWLSRCVDLGSKAARDEAFVRYGMTHTTLGKVLVNTPDSQFHEDDIVQAHPSFWGLFLVCPVNVNDKGTYRMDATLDKEWKQATVRGLQSRERGLLEAEGTALEKELLLISQDEVGYAKKLPAQSSIDMHTEGLKGLVLKREQTEKGSLDPEPKRLALEKLDTDIQKKRVLLQKAEDQQKKQLQDAVVNRKKRLVEIGDAMKRLEAIALGPDHRIYETLPRLFARSDIAPDGVYLHRSKAHGRDDFLVRVKGGGGDRMWAVWCTKGVGGDPSLIPEGTAGKYEHAKTFKHDWEAGTRTLFPFSTPAVGGDAGAGSWRRLGYCVAWGGEHDEIATVDFHNFLWMQRYAKALMEEKGGPFARISSLFVEPYACLEISCIQANRSRLGNIESAVTAGESGYPVQVVSGAPGETSLRVYKHSYPGFVDQQDYDYGLIDLELDEWERVHGWIEIPDAVGDKLGDDATGFRDAIAPVKVEVLLRRMKCAYRLLAAMVASYVTFLHAGWASDTYTGAFAGRNFSGGPRDANEWGLLGRLGRPNDGPAKVGTACATVDLQDLANTLSAEGDLMQMMEIVNLKGVALVGEDHRLLWNNGSLAKACTALGQAKKRVTDGLAASLSEDLGKTVNRSKELRKVLVRLWLVEAETFAQSQDPIVKALGAIFQALA